MNNLEQKIEDKLHDIVDDYIEQSSSACVEELLSLINSIRKESVEGFARYQNPDDYNDVADDVEEYLNGSAKKGKKE